MKEAEYHKRQMDWDKEDYPRLNAMALQIRNGPSGTNLQGNRKKIPAFRENGRS